MTRLLLLFGITIAGLVLVAAKAAPVSYNLPDETASLKPGPNLDVVKSNCTGCHSSDYISTQPQGPKFKKDFWQAEVTKMIKVYGAPIDEVRCRQDRRLPCRDLLNPGRTKACTASDLSGAFQAINIGLEPITVQQSYRKCPEMVHFGTNFSL